MFYGDNNDYFFSGHFLLYLDDCLMRFHHIGIVQSISLLGAVSARSYADVTLSVSLLGYVISDEFMFYSSLYFIPNY